MNEKCTCRGSLRWSGHWRPTASYSVPGHEFASQSCSDRVQGDVRRPPVSERLAPGPRRPARSATRRPTLARAAGTRLPRRHSPARRCSCCCHHQSVPLRFQSRRSVSSQIATQAAFRTARVSMCLARSLSRRVAARGEARTARRGGLILRVASRICLADFLRAPPAFHLQRCIWPWCCRRPPSRLCVVSVNCERHW